MTPIIIALCLALVAVSVVERSLANARLEAQRKDHRYEIAKVSEKKFHDGYRTAAVFYLKPRSHRRRDLYAPIAANHR